jgi:hypothetical protein
MGREFRNGHFANRCLLKKNVNNGSPQARFDGDPTT